VGKPIFHNRFTLFYPPISRCRAALYFSLSVIGIILTFKIKETLLIVFLGFYVMNRL